MTTAHADELMPAVPAPLVDADSKAYWDGLAEHEIRLPGCLECGKVRYPPLGDCPFCSAAGGAERVMSGRGSIYSFIVVHRTFHPAFEDQLPMVIAVVDLAEGPRVAARVVAAPEEVEIGAAVSAQFVDHPTWTELRFAPSAAGA